MVQYSSLNVAGSDYQAQSNFRIRWQADQVNQRTGANDPPLVFEIIDDDIGEDPFEFFEIDLSLNPTGNGRNGFFFPNAVGHITIVDDDAIFNTKI